MRLNIVVKTQNSNGWIESSFGSALGDKKIEGPECELNIESQSSSLGMLSNSEILILAISIFTNATSNLVSEWLGSKLFSNQPAETIVIINNIEVHSTQELNKILINIIEKEITNSPQAKTTQTAP